MPLVERSFFQAGYIADGYYETTIEFQGITLPPNRANEGFAYLLIAQLENQPLIRYSYNHASPIVGGIYYDPVITGISNLEKSIIDGSGAIGARLETTLGNITIGMEGGRNIDIAKKPWADQRFWLYRGPRYGSQSLLSNEFQLIYLGRFKAVRYNEDFIELIVGDSTNILDDIPSTRTFDGQTDVTGLSAPDLINKNVPRVWGDVSFVTPTLLSYQQQLYILHFRRIFQVTAAYDSLRPYAFVGDVPDGPPDSPPPGTFRTQNSDALMRLGSVPVGQLTVNIQGDYDSGFPAIGATLLRIILRLRSTYAPNLPLDILYFNEVLNQFPDRGGFYVGPDDTSTLADQFDLICQSMGIIWMMTANDTLRFQAFNFRTPYRTIQDEDLLSRATEPALPPVWKVEVRYDRSYTVHQLKDVESDLISDSVRSKGIQEWRTVETSDVAIKQFRTDARTLVVETALRDQPNAQNLANRLFTLHSVVREIVVAQTNNQNFVDEVGQTVHFKSDILGIEKDMIVVKINEQITERKTDLTLWG